MERVTYKTQSPKPEKANSGNDAKAMAWLEETGSVLMIEFDHTGPYFDDEEQQRDIYRVTLVRGMNAYTFSFGQSVSRSAPLVGNWPRNRGRYFFDGDSRGPDPEYKSNPDRAQPSAYSILASIEHYSPGAFEDFCRDTGYVPDSRRAEKTWRSCVDMWLSLYGMYSQEQLDKLAEII